MFHERHQSSRERKLTVADWLTSVFGIFWSVWWGFFMAKVIETGEFSVKISSSNTTEVIEISPIIYLTINAVLVTIFARSYVVWLWEIQRMPLSFSGFQRPLLHLSVPFGFSWFGLLSSIGFYGYSISNFPDQIIYYGIVITILWPIIIIVSVWGDG